MKSLTFAVVCAVALHSAAAAEEGATARSAWPPTLTATTLRSPVLSFSAVDADSGSKYEAWTTSDSVERRRQSPTVALLKSLVVPGWGQIGNHQYLKAGVVIGVEGLLFARWLHFRNQTVDARAAFEEVPLDELALRGQLFADFDRVRDRRNLFGWLTGTAIFLSMIDAFVDAHLSDFPAPGSSGSEAGSVSVHLMNPSLSSSVDSPGLGLALHYRF
ncbi:MAG TPA: DUF5683 domain-containing protein [candidate division Zixibacteria bacterium]|nr:DUF5683 domain-containing protein [candidate division Zixibacteria bacterium]